MYPIVTSKNKDRKVREARLMYTKDDYVLLSISKKSEKQSKLNVIARFRRRSKANLFLKPMVNKYKRQLISN